MNTVVIEGQLRTDSGKKAARDLRSQGNVLGVIYGGKEEVHFYAPVLSFRSLIYTSAFQIAEIKVDGKSYKAIVKDLQFDVVTDRLNHIDFLELVEDKKVIANLPFIFEGQPEGVKAGGRLQLRLKKVKVRAFPKDLTEGIKVDLTNLELNGNLRVEDIAAGNVEIMMSGRQPVASVVMTRALRQAETEAAKGKK
ncbi:50S ribosomal protein L25 [Edaphocola aurantiacus]|uniref:50S ribosomal protein L25 n=1 Tax=Edaphocola aurantiacus TaxID=2601682 RepID=UPI001C93FAFD|nr:50S ribosomal protein L25 [Edaphocola aurantiacus]